jgi:hypothetical protein
MWLEEEQIRVCSDQLVESLSKRCCKSRFLAVQPAKVAFGFYLDGVAVKELT